MRTCAWQMSREISRTVLECNHCTSELVEVVLSALSVFATEDRCGLAPLWAHLPLIIATPVTAPILVAALDALLDMPLSPDVAPPLPPPPHSSRTSPRTSDNLSGTLTNACKTTVRVRGPRRGCRVRFSSAFVYQICALARILGGWGENSRQLFATLTSTSWKLLLTEHVGCPTRTIRLLNYFDNQSRECKSLRSRSWKVTRAPRTLLGSSLKLNVVE